MTIDNEPEKLDGHSLDIAEERRRELLRLFPEVRTDRRADDCRHAGGVHPEEVNPWRSDPHHQRAASEP